MVLLDEFHLGFVDPLQPIPAETPIKADVTVSAVIAADLQLAFTYGTIT